MIDIPADGHLDGAREGFEDTLDFVMLVRPLGADVEVHHRRVAQALEEMEEHLGRDVADVFAAELGVPNQPRPAAEVERDAAKAVVHRETEAVTLDAALVAQCFTQCLAERERRVLDGVMLVHLQVALDADGEIHARVPADLLQHVVEKAEAGEDVGAALAVEVEVDGDVRFLRRAADGGAPLTGKEELRDAVPIGGDERGAHLGMLREELGGDLVVGVEPDALRAEVGG